MPKTPQPTLSPGQRDVVSLKEFLEVRFETLERAYDKHLAKIEAHLENVDRLANSFITKEESNSLRAAIKNELQLEIVHLQAEVELLKTFQTQIETKASQGSVDEAKRFAVIAAIVGVLSLMLTVIDLIGKF